MMLSMCKWPHFFFVGEGGLNNLFPEQNFREKLNDPMDDIIFFHGSHGTEVLLVGEMLGDGKQ